MAKIILSKGDTVLREIALTKERITIGRRPHNDIVIEDLAISGEHAVIVTHNDDSFLEDLNSTNGTQVNGQPVRKHFLQDGDVVELAQFRMRYVGMGSIDLAATKPLIGNHANSIAFPRLTAAIKVLNGPNAGKEISLNKPVTTIGRPGVQVAVLTYAGSCYFLAPIEGDYPLLNGQIVDMHPCQLADGDVIDLSGTQMQLQFS